MRPNKLNDIIGQGNAELYTKGQVFYALDFKAEIYVVTKGFVKRYQVTTENERVIESIYGPGYIFPLTQAFKELFDYDLSQESATYVYEAMTDIEIRGIKGKTLNSAVKDKPELGLDLFYEAGRRLKANINRLTSNAIKDDYKKIAHQLVYLADEFGKTVQTSGESKTYIQVPLTPKDMAEQLNISTHIADAVMANLEKHGLIQIDEDHVFIPNINLLKDAYLIGVSI